MLKKIIFTFVFFAMLSTTASGEIPPEVLQPYKQYRAALEKYDDAKVRKYALEAWEQAEKLLGDHKTTGDLAHNYAVFEAGSDILNPKKNYKKRRLAYARSIELASYYSKQANEIELDRRIQQVELDLIYAEDRANFKSKAEIKPNFKDLEKKIIEFGLSGTTFEADYEALLARYYGLKAYHNKVIEHAALAIKLYQTREDKSFSKYQYFVRFIKGNSHFEQGEKIPAALEYQTVMQNLEGTLPADHIFVKRAFTNWVSVRNEIEEAGQLEVAEKAGLCECWPFENYKNKAVPVKQIPPIMPSNAKRSGHVIVQYDVNDQGHPENIEAISSSNPLFIKAAVKSIKEWRYNKLGADVEGAQRKQIITGITFKLIDRRGNLIPER